MFTLTIETGGAAFEERGPSAEVARLLRRAAARVEDMSPGDTVPLLDANGNTCGSVNWSEEG